MTFPYKTSQGFGLLPLIIIIAIAAALTGGGLYLQQKVKQMDLKQSAAQNDQQRMGMKGKVETNSYAMVDISGWKTYTSERYGFEVKYPADFLLDSSQANGISFRNT